MPPAMTLALVGAVLTITAVQAQDQAKPDTANSVESNLAAMETTRQTLEKWVEARKLIAQERRDWAIGRSVLQDRLELYQREIETVRLRITETQAGITETDKTRVALEKQHQELKDASAGLTQRVAEMEERTRALLKRLPDPITERIKPLSQRLPVDSKESNLSLAVRFQNIVGILNEINKFNREITVTSEVRALPNGKSAEVTTMYLGIGQGYYVGSGGTIAGVGTATSDGWVWIPADHAAAQIAQAIAVFKNEQTATFVTVPVEIHQSQEQNQ